ncbi:MAG: tetratricopeptide repeat protein, partial [Planctomycetota bacterium]
MGTLAAVLPPPQPDPGADFWSAHLLAHPGPLPAGEAAAADSVSSEVQPSPDSGSAQAGAAQPSAGEGEAAYAALYDSVRLNPLTTLWGRILDADRFDKKKGSPFVFQEVDPRTGQARFTPRRFEGGDYESFSFARTQRNEIELRVHALRPVAGTIEERLDLVHWLLDQGNSEPVAFERAVALAEKGVRLAPDDEKTWLALGDAWERTFHLDEAFALYSRMAGVGLPDAASLPGPVAALPSGRFSRRAAPRVRLARILRSLGLDREAEKLLREGVGLSDGDSEAPLELGLLLADTGRPREAEGFLRRALGMQTSRSSPAALRNAGALGKALLEQGDWDGARRVYAEGVRAAGGIARARDLQAGEVAALYLAGDFPAALEAARQAVATIGPDPGLLYLRGITAAAAGGPADRVDHDLRDAARLGPLDAAPALAALSFWTDVDGRPGEARQLLARALELEPDLPYGIYLRAHQARRDGELDSAEKEFRRLLGRFPHCAAALVELGWVFHLEERFAEAEVALRRGAAEAPRWAEASFRRGLNLLRLGLIPAAREALQTARDLDGKLEGVRNALAWAAYAEGDVPGTVAEFSYTQDLLREDEKNPQYVFAKTWQDRVAAHARLVRWADDFGTRRLRNGWNVDARHGVEPRPLDGSLVLAGNHADAGRTRVYREISAIRFSSFAADLEVEAGHLGEAGLMLSLENRTRTTWEFRVFRDREGRLRWFLRQGAREERGEVPGGLAAGGTA